MRVINSVLGDATGGRWRIACEYARLLQAQGHEVVMLLSDALPRALPGIPPGIEVQRIRNHGHYDWLAAWRLRRRLRKRAPAIAIAHCSRSAALLKHALGKTAPVIAVTHSMKVRRLLVADAVIALTDELRDSIHAEPAGRRLPVHVVPNPVAIPDACPSQRLPAGQPPRIGALGRFDRVKGFDVLIEALGLLAKQGVGFTARLAGAGVEEARLDSRIRALGLADRVALDDWIPSDAVPAFLAELDLLCVPARRDAFGLTPLQGAAAGVPLVLSTASGHRAMFARESEALFFEVDDAAALAQQIRRLLDDAGLRRQLAVAALARIEQCYSPAAVTRGILTAIDNTLNIYRNK